MADGADRVRSLSSHNGSTITFHDLHYTVNVKAENKKCGTTPKEILHGLNGIFKPGMNAILGPTGGGKSSMLDILAGRKDPKGLEGIVLVDGNPQPENFKCITGYVVQDDVVLGTLTVRENFMFSANLRLDRSISTAEKEDRVNDAIFELGLTGCADTKVGTEFIRGVSGGERKRTNIGMELIIQPKVLFLDEPTTGLDASTANAVMAILHRLSQRGRTIIFSIHQPRFSIFRYFDRLLLLGGGRTIFHGPSTQAIQYFSEIGFECEEHNNPPDFFLDVINGDSTAVLNMERNVKLDADVIGNGDAIVEVDRVDVNKTSLSEILSSKFTDHHLYKEVREEIDPVFEKYSSEKKAVVRIQTRSSIYQYQTSLAVQLWYVSKRTLLNLLRSPQASLLQFVVMLIFALLVGVIYFQLGDDIDGALQNRVGAFFFIIMNQIFGNLSTIELFIKERAIFIHQSASGFYRVSAYFFAKLFCDVIPMRLIPLIPFSLIVYFMVGFQIAVDKFFIFFLDLFLTTLAASSVGFAISSSVDIFAVANLLIALIFVIMMVFGGLLANLQTMASWLSWLQYLSIVRYSLNTLSINELKDITLYKYENGTKYPVTNAGTNFLESQGIKYETAWDLWQNQMALALISLGFLVIAYIQLRRIPKLK